MSKRNRKPSAKEQERMRTAVQQQEPEKSMWCLVQLEKQDGSKIEEVVCSKYLELENGNAVTSTDLYFGNMVIWVHKKRPYEATILEIHRTKPSLKRKVTFDDSSDEDNDNVIESLADKNRSKKQRIHKNSIRPGILPSTEQHNLNNYDTMPQLMTDSDVDHEEEISVENGSGPSTYHFEQTSHQKVARHEDNAAQANDEFKIPFSSSSSFITPTTQLVNDKANPHQIIHEQLKRIETKLDQLLQNTASIAKKKSNPVKSGEDEDEKYIMESGVNLLKIRADNPFKYALHLMDTLFSDTEMAKSCFSTSKRSNKPALDSTKVAFLEDCIKKKFQFNEKQFDEIATQMRRKCSQKCIDKARSLGIKKETAAAPVDQQ